MSGASDANSSISTVPESVTIRARGKSGEPEEIFYRERCFGCEQPDFYTPLTGAASRAVQVALAGGNFLP